MQDGAGMDGFIEYPGLEGGSPEAKAGGSAA